MSLKTCRVNDLVATKSLFVNDLTTIRLFRPCLRVDIPPQLITFKEKPYSVDLKNC
jgi:hypothetical protein